MKIAVATDDGQTPARHFGKAPGYVVFTVENDQITGREQRAKPVCDHGPGHSHHEDSHDDGPDLHTRMSDVIADCQVVMAAGIPGPMLQHLTSAGLQPFVVQARSVEDALNAYLAGRIF